MTKKFLLLLALAGTLPSFAYADNVAACTAGEIYTIENTTCTIGDKTFQFGMATATPFGNVIIVGPDTAFYFTPDGSNPNSPGFTISPTNGGSFGTPPPTTLESGFEYSLPYTVTTSGGDIIGTTATTGAFSVGMNGGGSAEAVATSTLSPGSFLCVDIAESGASTSGALAFGSTDDKLILGCGGVTTTPGTATITLLEQNGMASLQDGGFYIDESSGSQIGGGGSTVPEPATFVLLAVGLLAMAAGRASKGLLDLRRSHVEGRTL
jgi:PEP-CTERM motif